MEEENPIKKGKLKGRDEKGRFIRGEYEGGPGRPKGSKNWQTDFNEAVKSIAKKLKKTESEIRTMLLEKGIAESLQGNYNFWKEIIERNYGKIKEPLEITGEISTTEDNTLIDLLKKTDEQTRKKIINELVKVIEQKDN